jgi:hypothetical protein
MKIIIIEFVYMELDLSLILSQFDSRTQFRLIQFSLNLI